MPPTLHPRSTWTTSLFGTTLAVSFLVVGMPHLFPCPAPRVALADTEVLPDGRRVRRKRRVEEDLTGDAGEQPQSRRSSGKKEAAESKSENKEGEVEVMEVSRGRECPVPKPRVVLGSVLGLLDGVGKRREGDAGGKSG